MLVQLVLFFIPTGIKSKVMKFILNKKVKRWVFYDFGTQRPHQQGHIHPGPLKKLPVQFSANSRLRIRVDFHRFTIDAQKKKLKFLAFKGLHKGLSFFLGFFQYRDLNKWEQCECAQFWAMKQVWSEVEACVMVEVSQLEIKGSFVSMLHIFIEEKRKKNDCQQFQI